MFDSTFQSQREGDASAAAGETFDSYGLLCQHVVDTAAMLARESREPQESLP